MQKIHLKIYKYTNPTIWGPSIPIQRQGILYSTWYKNPSSLTSLHLSIALCTSTLLLYSPKLLYNFCKTVSHITMEWGPTNENAWKQNSRTAQELSKKVKFIENGQDLTTWLAHESSHIPRRQDFSNFDDLYLPPQRCREVRFLVIWIVLIYSINCQNVESLHHQQRCFQLRWSWPKPQNSALLFPQNCPSPQRNLCY